MLISVIVPIYNMEHLISKCLTSILNQTYENIEVIIVDDGSTDSSNEIIKNYAQQDHRVKILEQSNQGTWIAKNNGLKIAKGEFITIVDADDYILSDTFEKNIRYFKQDYSLDVVQFPCQMVDEKNNIINTLKPSKRIINSEKEYLEFYFSGIITGFVWGKIFRRNVLTAFKFPEISNSGDSYVQPDIAHYSRKTMISEEGMYYYYQNPMSITKTKYTLIKSLSTLFMLRKTYSTLLDFKIEKAVKLNRFFHSVGFLCETIVLYGESNVVEYISYFSENMPSYQDLFLNKKYLYRKKCKPLLMKFFGIRGYSKFLFLIRKLK